MADAKNEEKWQKCKAFLPIICSDCTRLLPVGTEYFHRLSDKRRRCTDCMIGAKLHGGTAADMFKSFGSFFGDQFGE